MSRRLSRISLAFLILVSSEVWALGLGDIRLDSALNEPLRAEIQLLAATPQELENLTISLASADTFERYGLDRPAYLQNIVFTLVRSGRSDGNVVQLRSAGPMAEPFLTFLVEATWSRGRLLREYTVLLDPPTFAPSTQATPAVQAPSRSTPADSGQIPRPAAQPQPQPQPQVRAPAAQPSPAPRAVPAADNTPYDTTAGGDYTVTSGETLWGVASRVRPDSRLTMNQTMIAIFQANPEAFGGNINILRAGSRLRVPSADEIFRISRADALAEAQRQHAAWSGGTVAVVEDTTTRPDLTLVPPDEDIIPEPVVESEPYESDTDFTDAITPEPLGREQEILDRIAELEGADVPQQQSLIEIRDNELAALREELSRIRGEELEPPADEIDPFADAEPDLSADETADAVDTEPVAEPAPRPDTIIRQPSREEDSGFFGQLLELVKEQWMIVVGGAVAFVGALLFWFMRRGGGDDEDVDSWQPLDAGDDDLSATESLRAPVGDESIVVVEQKSPAPPVERAVETPAVDLEETVESASPAPVPAKDDTGTFDSLEDTFSSETAINLDQTDPIAEADFHMAYGLYDQAADLINGALEIEPERQDLLTKACEIYFVWGNRDAFIDAAGKLKAAVGDADSDDWNKIVIMGQQIAGDDALFSGASAAGATRAVDLAFEGDLQDTGALDMELFAEAEADVLDIGSADEEETGAVPAADETGGVDFLFDDDETEVAGSGEDTDYDITREMPASDETAEMPTVESPMDTPTIEQQFDSLAGTSELPSLEETLGEALGESGLDSDETSEINLDELDLGIDGLAETELASLDDLDATGELPSLEDTGINEGLEDSGVITGRNPEVDPDATGVQRALDDSLLDATGVTQVLSSDMAVDTTGINEALDIDETTIGDDQETMLASLDDDDDDLGEFDFAKTEALPKEAFTGEHSLEETGEMPALAGTDVDLDLDDLTAALQVSDLAGDTVEQLRDDATVEQPRPTPSLDDTSETLSIDPDDMSDDLAEARTMTEVGTKLDLARAYVDMGDPAGARSILEEVLDEGDEAQRQQAQQLLDSLPG